MPSAEDSFLDAIFASGGGGESAGFLAILSDSKLEKLLVTSEIPPPAVLDFSVSLLFARTFNSKIIKEFLRSLLQAQTIKDRRRTTELVELFQSRGGGGSGSEGGD